MKKTQLTLALLVATGVAAAPLAAEAMTHKKHHRHHTMSSQTTTGTNAKSSGGSSSQGNVNQPGSMNSPAPSK